jgi:hypothetical protein
MLAGNFSFVALNPGFALVLGGIYWLLALLGAAFSADIWYIAPLLLSSGFWAYTKNQEGGGKKIFLVSLANGIVHTLAFLMVMRAVAWLTIGIVDAATWPRLAFVLHAAVTIVLGGAVAGSLFGAYLYITSRWLNMNHNDAFSSMRRDSHKNFLRLRIKGDEVTVFPVGLEQAPARDAWRVNEAKIGAPPPAFIPATPLAPHLVETPFTIVAR